MNELHCLIFDCSKQIYARGLCFAHYRSAQSSVKKGRTTWEKLVADGMALDVYENPMHSACAEPRKELF